MGVVEEFVKQIRGSGLGNCPCRLAYQAYQRVDKREVGVEKSTPSSHLVDPRLTDGHWHEFEVKKRLVGLGVVFFSGLDTIQEVEVRIDHGFNVLGHVDGEVRVAGGMLKGVKAGDYLLEVKSMAPGSYWRFVKGGYREAFPEYFDQLQGYLHGEVRHRSATWVDDSNPVADLYPTIAHFEVSDAHWKYPRVGLVVAKNKETGGIWCEVVDSDDSYFRGLCRRWIEAREAVERGGLPTCIHEEDVPHWEKERCECGKGGKEVALLSAKTIAPVDASLLENARIYAAGSRLRDLAESMIEYAEPSLTLATEGKAQVGPVMITQYKQRRTSWDHQMIEELVPPQVLPMIKKEKETVVTRRTVGEFSNEEVREVMEAIRGREVYPLLEEGVL